jgi:hypothetical protein
MTNSKRKCLGCQKYFKTETMIELRVGNFHSYDCATSYAMSPTPAKIDRVRKLEKKDDSLRVKVFRASDLKIRKDAAKTACHAYIRARDHGKPCICCNRPYTKTFQAGHFLESGNNPDIRYDEDNIHGQSVYCNKFKGGDSDDYRGNLIKKVGLVTVKRLESLRGGTVKRTPDDYKEIETYFKDKLKQLEGE